MSHFSVCVVTHPGGPNVKQLLAPYAEELQVTAYKDYLAADHYLITATTKEGADITDPVSFCEAYTKKWAEEDGDGALFHDEKGYYTWSTYNPQSKWDWYAEGGCYAGRLLQKGEPEPVNTSRLRDLDWDRMLVMRQIALSEYWDELQTMSEDRRKFHLWGEVLPATKEEYVAKAKVLIAYAYLDKDGWVAQNKMGWWGISVGEETENWDEIFLTKVKGLPLDCTITIVDCHI